MSCLARGDRENPPLKDPLTLSRLGEDPLSCSRGNREDPPSLSCLAATGKNETTETPDSAVVQQSALALVPSFSATKRCEQRSTCAKVDFLGRGQIDFDGVNFCGRGQIDFDGVLTIASASLDGSARLWTAPSPLTALATVADIPWGVVTLAGVAVSPHGG